MAPSFIAYVDESGDEGFRFQDGSSCWFVLSAAVFRASDEREVVDVMRKVRKSLGKPPNFTMHFRNLKHPQRVAYLNEVALSKCLAISVACNKSMLTENEYLQEKNALYFYSVRLLAERISWYCRDSRPRGDVGDGTVEIVFSNRSNLSYEDLRSYLEQLRIQSTTEQVRIDWSIVKTARIRALPHQQRAGLQVADALASSFFVAFEPSTYGYPDENYTRILGPVMYRKKAQLKGYGLKIWPQEALLRIREEGRLVWALE